VTAQARLFAAQLRCGTKLHYEWASLLPELGETVPCRHHGFCAVVSVFEASARAPLRPSRRRPAPPSTDDLISYLRSRRRAWFSELRRHRFTLRVICAAHAHGVVEIDWNAGCVDLRLPEPT
jgi:hypothetical protein